MDADSLVCNVRVDKRDGLTLSTPVDTKITQVSGHYAMFWIQFAHPYQAEISEVRGAISILGGQFAQSRQVRGEFEGGSHKAFTREGQNQIRVSQVEGGFRENGITG